MPITNQEGAGQALAYENQLMEAELQQLAAAQQARAAALHIHPSVPARFRQRRDVAAGRVNAARQAVGRAEQAVRAEIARKRPADTTARMWFDAALGEPNAQLRDAEAELERAERALGEQNLAYQHLDQLTASASARRAEAEQRYLQRLDAIDRELLLARAKCATE